MQSSIAEKKTSRLLATIDLLYDAVCDLDRWPAFLESAALLFESKGAQVAHQNLANNSVSFSRVYGYDWDSEHYRKYDELMSEDPRLAYFSANKFRSVHCRMGISEEELHDSRVYKEVLSKGGVEYSMGINLEEQDHSLSYFVVLRGENQPPFNDDDCDLMDRLMPHLRRVLLLQSKVGKIEFDKHLVDDALDSMGVGIAIIDGNCSIEFANHCAKLILSEDDGIKELNGSLVASKGVSKVISSCAQKIITQAKTGNNSPGEALTINRPSGLDPYIVFISSFWGNHVRYGWAHVKEPYALLIVRDPNHSSETRLEILSRVYGLTPSQARIATMLSDGLSIKDAAQECGIAESSARQYTKMVYQKMGVRRQGDMIRKILSLPL